MKVSKNAAQIILAVLLIILVVYLSYYPLFHGDAWWGHDAMAHLNRVYGTLHNLSLGQFPPYFDVEFRNYPGYSWNLFYPPLYNLIASPIQYFAKDYNVTIKLVSMVIGVVALRCAFLLFYLQNSDFYRSLLLALCYACSLYMVDNIFIRFALPESLALAFFPLLAAGLLTADKKQSLKYLIFANTFILLTNIPVAILSILFVSLYFAFYPRQINKIIIFIKAYIISLLLASWFVFPLIYTVYQSSFIIMESNHFELMSRNSVDLYNFISGRVIRQDPLRGMVLGIGYPLFVVFIWCIWKNKNILEKNNLMIFLLTFCITTSVNYSFLPDIFTIFSKIQFTWRLIPLVVILILLEINKTKKINAQYIMIMLLITALMSTHMTIITYEVRANKKDLNHAGSLFEKVHYLDYVSSEAAKKKDKVNPQFLFCQINTKDIRIKYDKKIDQDGLPLYLFNLPDKATCLIPFVAYKPLYLKGVENYQYDGFFQVNLAKGQHKIAVKIKPIFKYILYASILLAIITLCLLMRTLLFKKTVS